MVADLFAQVLDPAPYIFTRDHREIIRADDSTPKSPDGPTLAYTDYPMGGIRGKKELQSVEEFREALEEEISVSVEFGITLCVLVLSTEEEWEPEAERRVLDSLRNADLITKTGASELAVALPNTVPADAERVKRRLAKAIPEAAIGISDLDGGGSIDGLLDRAREAAESPEST